MDRPKRSYDPPEQPEHEDPGEGDEGSFDRSQPELTEETLLVEEFEKTDDPEEQRELESDLEEMSGDVEDANSK